MEFCPECGIGLNNHEKAVRFCQNCKAYWEEDDEYKFENDYEKSGEGYQFDDLDDDSFEPCSNCDLPDACADFGCAIKSGIRKNYPIDGVF
jgi:hypothetical protein